jgi:capsular polysaccharide biosynthesis protein
MPFPADLLGRLLRQSGVLAGAVLLGALTDGVYGLWKTPTYSADAHVVVVNTATAPDDQTAVKFAQAYGRISTDTAVLGATKTVKDGTSSATLRRQIRVETSPDAPLVQITGVAPTGAQAAEIANEVANSLIAFGNGRRTSTGVRLASFAQASIPDRPSSPNKPVDIAVGAAAGLLIGGFATTAGIGGRRRQRTTVEPRVNGTVNGNPRIRAYPMAEPARSEHGARR